MTKDVLAFSGFDVAIDLERWPAKILRALFRRHYEKHELRLVSRLLKPSDRVIELGSAIGVVALAASRIVPPEHIACFDANPDMVAEAKSNFAINHKDISAQNAVLVADAGAPPEVTFYRSPYFLSSSLQQRGADATPIQVETASLIRSISKSDANVLIVDIEGGEFDLLGSADLSTIETLILELHVSMADVETCMDLIGSLARQGLALHTGLVAHNVFVFVRRGEACASKPEHMEFARSYLSGLEKSDAGDQSGAVECVQRAVQAHPANAHAHLLLSQLLAKTDTPERALEAAEWSIRLDTQNEDTLEQLGVLHSALGNLETGERAYRHAISHTPHRPLFYAGLACVLAQLDRRDDALEALAASISLIPQAACTIEFVLALQSRTDKFASSQAASSPAKPCQTGRFLHSLAGEVERSFRFADAASALALAQGLAPSNDVLQCGLAALLATPKNIRNALETGLNSN